MKITMLKNWLLQIRAPFLILSVVLVLIGVGAAYYYTHISLFKSVLLMVGVILAHIAVNLFNEISDFATKIDVFTKRTPFSGGSGMLVSGKTNLQHVRLAAYLTLFFAYIIGMYFVFTSGCLILGFMIIGFAAIYFYTSHLSKWLLGELFAGIALGSLVVAGVFYALTLHLPSAIVLLSIPPGIFTALLLLVNEIPDMKADKQGGRLHLVILLGAKRSVYLYSILLALAYVIILFMPLHKGIPVSIFLALGTIPLAVTTCVTALKNINHDKFQQAQALNVAVILLTDFLLAVGMMFGKY